MEGPRGEQAWDFASMARSVREVSGLSDGELCVRTAVCGGSSSRVGPRAEEILYTEAVPGAERRQCPQVGP